MPTSNKSLPSSNYKVLLKSIHPEYRIQTNFIRILDESVGRYIKTLTPAMIETKSKRFSKAWDNRESIFVDYEWRFGDSGIYEESVNLKLNPAKVAKLIPGANPILATYVLQKHILKIIRLYDAIYALEKSDKPKYSNEYLVTVLYTYNMY